MASDPETVAVLGVGPGLGAAVAERFGEEGYSVALMSRSGKGHGEAEEAIESHGGRAVTVAVDATDPESVAEGFAEATEAIGSIGVLVYNAGTFQRGGILEVEPAAFEKCWKANCFGAFLAAREVLPDMVERGSGTVLLTGATAAWRGGAGFTCLSVGKFGLRSLAQSMAREVGPQGIHVAHVVVDGQIDTPGLREAQPDRESHTLLSPYAIAETYWQLHCQDPTAWSLEVDLRPAVESF